MLIREWSEEFLETGHQFNDYISINPVIGRKLWHAISLSLSLSLLQNFATYIMARNRPISYLKSIVRMSYFRTGV